MNTITGILSRELLNKESTLNILWTHLDSLSYDKTIRSLNHNLITFDHLYFAKDTPNIIICNNKVLYYKKCRDISIQFHIPVIVIDHDIKPENLTDTNEDDNTLYNFPTQYNIAMSEEIANSWQTNYDKIIKPEEIKNKEYWSELIYNTSKIIFKYYG